MTRSNPTVARRRLAVRLREARERRGRSLEELSRFLSVSLPQASRLDSGARGYPPKVVGRLAEWYGMTDSARQELVALADDSRKRQWWQQVDLRDSYRTLIGMEQAAQSISEYAVSVVPGLLQTPEYARVAASVGDAETGSEVDDDRIDQAVEVRMRRQRILDRPTPPTLNVVIDEAILARGPRDPAIRRAQLVHLREATDRPRIVVQVVGFEYGIYTGASSHFILLGMGGDVPDLLYSQGSWGEYDSSDPDALGRYRAFWNDLRTKALDVLASKDRIEKYIRAST